MIATLLAFWAFQAHHGVHWEPSPGADSYNVYESVGVTGEFTRVATGVPCCSYYPVKGWATFPVWAGEWYRFAVSAVNAAGESALSESVTIVTDNPRGIWDVNRGFGPWEP